MGGEQIDKKLSTNWAIAGLGSAGIVVGVNFFELVNLDTQRAHSAILTSAGVNVGGTASAGPVTYDRFNTSRPVAFADFDGVGARISSANLIAYSFGWLTIWDGPAYVSDRLAYVRMSSWGIGVPGGGSAHGVLVIAYGFGIPLNMGGYQATPVPIPTPVIDDTPVRVTVHVDATWITVPADALFEFDKWNIKPEARPALIAAGDAIRANSGHQIWIEGHTDGIGKPDYNLRLSKLRADAVKQWLISNGYVTATDDKVDTRGLGDTRLAEPEKRPDGSDDKVGRAKNRRVEFIIMKR